MTCSEVREHFTDLLDEVDRGPGGGDGVADRAGITAHVAECAECRQELESLQGTLALLHAVEPPRAPVGFVDRVLVAVRPPWYRRLGRALLWPLHVKLPLEAAAIVLVSLGIVYVFQRTPELQDAARPGASVDAVAESGHPPEPPVGDPAAEERARAASESRTAAAPPAAKDRRPAFPAPDDEQYRQPRSSTLARDAPGERVQPAQRDAADAAPSARRKTNDAAPAGPPATDVGERGSRAAETDKELSRQEPIPSGPPPGGPTEPATRRAESFRAAPQRESQDAARVRGTLAAKTASPEAQGRLAVADVEDAERRIRDVATRFDGAVTGRAPDDGAVLLELSVPGRYYSDLVRELAVLGRFTPPPDLHPVPPHVRLVIRLER